MTADRAGAITFSDRRDLPREAVLALYRANRWSSADQPEKLLQALAGSHSVITAWNSDVLAGLGNAITDGHLVVYYPHLLVHPDYQGCSVGAGIVAALKARYQGFHQHMLVADAPAIGFYEKCGFTRAGTTQSMWIYAGDDH